MTVRTDDNIADPSVLDHDLNRYFPELLKFESTQEMEASDLYPKIQPEVDRILNSIVGEEFTEPLNDSPSSIRAVAWNIERGAVFEGIVDALQHNERLAADVLLLTELDHGMARSGNRFVAREIAQRLKLNYAFAPVYIALQKGSGVESAIEGENTVSIHGLAVFSKYPIRNAVTVALPNGKDKMLGKEKRLGYLRALIADIDHPLGTFRSVTVHLDAALFA